MTKTFSFRFDAGLGDIVVLSAFVRDLELAFPGQYRLAIEGAFPSFWREFPNVSVGRPDLGTSIDMSYQGGINASKKGLKKHFLTSAYRKFREQTGIIVPATKPHGDIRERPGHMDRPVPEKYWLVCAGGKLDITNKWWLPTRWQAVVDELLKRGIVCMQVGMNGTKSYHPFLSNVIQRVDTTSDIVDAINLVRHAEGVICGVTSFMHIAAALHKPCVVVAGGREEWWWEAYSNHGQLGDFAEPVKVEHKFLHTIGRLDCCKETGCWTARVKPLEFHDLSGTNRVCSLPVFSEEQPVAKCLTLIEPKHVVSAVQSYYDSGVLTLEQAPGNLKLSEAPQEPQKKPLLLVEPQVSQEHFQFRALDHPLVGGKFTVFVLCYGDHPQLARNCLLSIVNSLPAHRLDLRIGLNGVCQETKDFIRSLGPVVRKVYSHDENIKKYPLMRRMFHDPERPIETKYLVWFDDDTRVVDQAWAAHLAISIAESHPHGSRLFGTRFVHDLTNPRADKSWFTSAPWWKGLHLRERSRPVTSADGTCVDFVAGYFWALSVDTMREADIPDPRLNHNGGDITIGAQVIQQGAAIRQFNLAKSIVWCPTREQGGRRGYSEDFPWLTR